MTSARLSLKFKAAGFGSVDCRFRFIADMFVLLDFTGICIAADVILFGKSWFSGMRLLKANIASHCKLSVHYACRQHCALCLQATFLEMANTHATAILGKLETDILPD